MQVQTKKPLSRVSPELLRELIWSLPTGTTIFCHNPKPPVCKTIRAGINSFWDHTETVYWKDGQPYVVGARGHQTVQPLCFYEFLRCRPDNHFGVSPAVVDPKRIESQFGKNYDYWGPCFYMPIYRVSGQWIGPKNEAAQKSYFCFELSAWYRELPEWWCKVPDKFPT